MQVFPVFARLAGREVLLVGGGNIAARKLRLLQRSGARITLVATRFCPEVQRARGRVTLIERRFAAGDLAGVYLVVSAADAATNHAVAAAAKSRHLLVNVVDDAARSSWVFPAIVDRSPLVIGISTAGAAPVLARKLRTQIEAALPQSLSALARMAGRWRQRVAKKIPDLVQRRRFWENFFTTAAHGGGDSIQGLLDKPLTPHETRGEVYLIGAGPGAADLMTLRGLQLLQRADWVLHDRLVSTETLELARRDAHRVATGKVCGGKSWPQEKINTLMIDAARRGLRVARLKGGDPLLFGRGGEEALALSRAGVRFEIVPGISAANGCAAYAGIPLTQRGFSQAVTLVTGHGAKSDPDWSALVRSRTTLVIFMGLGNWLRIRRCLLDAGMLDTTPVALVQSGTTIRQQTRHAMLAHGKDLTAGVDPPALIIVGQVASLAAELQWFQSPESPGAESFVHHALEFSA